MKPPAAKANAPTPAKPTGASVKTSVKKTVKNTVSKTPEKANAGDRIAKVLARAGVASRREAERMIELGRVAVNGKLIDSPALNVGGHDKITVDGKPVAQPEPARLWLYYKPLGLVTSERDEKGRPTVFDHLPEDLPRVMSVGRLDLNSEGLLLLTNDGEIKRRLELPSTGWLRKYRVRVNGAVTDALLEPLRKGITVEGERFQPMAVTLDKVQGANAWLTIGIREGRNREIRRAINHIGLIVNRLIRTSYGPFKLGVMEPGTVEEIRPKIMRDQLGLTEVPEPESAPPPTGAKPRTAKPQIGKSTGRSAGKPGGKLGAKFGTDLTPEGTGTKFGAKFGARGKFGAKAPSSGRATQMGGARPTGAPRPSGGTRGGPKGR